MNPRSDIEEAHPWTFNLSQLTAGLRNHTGDNKLIIKEVEEFELPGRRPSMGRIRGLRVSCSGATGSQSYEMVIKEPQGTTRVGMAGAGRREVSFYRVLGEQIPIQIPQLVAAHAGGNWLALSLLPEGTDSLYWKRDDYLLAIDNLVTLHDRFWNLEADLGTYAWLGRPLVGDFQIYLQAAIAGLERLSGQGSAFLLEQESNLLQTLEQLIQQAGKVAHVLKEVPSTLIHGDYWPGNLIVYPGDNIVAYDWQQVSIGPGILDLLKFVQASHWWFSPLPVSERDLTDRYRSALARINGYTWTDPMWEKFWDHALLWTFLVDWMDVLAHIPAPILKTRWDTIECIWLEPVREAIYRHLKE